MTDLQNLIANSLSPFTMLFGRLDEIITPQRSFAFFQTIADTPAPSLTTSYTRAPIIQQLIAEGQQAGICGQNLAAHNNYLGSGNMALSIGQQPKKPIWSMAHLDNISFLTGEYRDGCYALTPFCEARQTEGRRPAVALNYAYASGTMEVVASGWLCSEKGSHSFECDQADLPPATRIVYASQAAWDRQSGLVTGMIDNAFGCAALLLSAFVLSHFDVEAMIVLTDEEEGVVATGPPAFSRGATRLINRITPEQLPDIITISDHHEDVENLMRGKLDLARFGQGALFAAFASGTKGGVTPPRLLAFQRELAIYLQEHQILLNENPGYVSRSDCVSAMMATPNVALVGYPGAYSHFIDMPRAHIDDLVNLAKTLVIYSLVVQNREWRSLFLGDCG